MKNISTKYIFYDIFILTRKDKILPRINPIKERVDSRPNKDCSNSPSYKNQPENNKPKRKDIYAQMPLRLLGYSNEIGEAIRPLNSTLANLSWLPAIGYICADTADKYRQDENCENNPSKRKVSKQLITQLLMSVFLPTVAVKAGQGLTNGVSAFGKTKLTINTREKISDMILESMKQGRHKDFSLADGKIDKEAYNSSLSDRLEEISKHKNTHNKLNPLASIFDFIKKPFMISEKKEDVEKYSMKVIDRVIDERQHLIDGVKPDKMSNSRFKKFLNDTKNISQSEIRSVAYDFIRKSEKSRMFNNKILKSIGGLLALTVMSKPIDEFVKDVAMEQYVSPQIDSFAEFMHAQK